MINHGGIARVMVQQSGIVSDGPLAEEKKVLPFPNSANDENNTRLLINGWQIRPIENRLVKGPSEIRLEPKSMDLLLRLVAAKGDALSRSELISALWPNVYASDDSLNRIVSRLRRSLAEDEALKSAVITVPKRGYRLKKRVIETAANGAPDAVQSDAAQSGAGQVKQRRTLLESWNFRAGIASLILVAAFIFYSQVNRPQDIDYFDLQSRPLTRMVGREDGARFSPDGQYVAYSWNKETAQNSDIYIQKIGEYAPQKITQHPFAEINPAWSPSGQSLAFVRTNSSGACNIVTLELESLAEKVIHNCNTGNGVDLSWGRDANDLYFTDRIGATGPFAVHRLNLETDQAQQISFPASTGLGDFVVRVSPNGEEISFVRRTTYIDTDIYVAAEDGSHPRQITQNQRSISGLSWDADNTHLYFTTNRASAFGLWRTGKLDRRTQPIPSVLGDANSVTVSPDGASMIIGTNRINSQVQMLSLSSPALDTPLNANGVSSEDQFLDLASSGEQFAYYSNRSGEPGLWLSGTDAEKLITPDVDLLMSANWSPDGEQILIGAFAKGNFDLYLVTPDVGTVQRLTQHPSSDYNPTWSSDGNYAYFTSNRTGRFQIWCIEIKTGNVEQITLNGGHRAIEIDGKRLFFAKKHADGLFELDLKMPGATEQLVTGGLSALDWRNWDVVGERLYYVNREHQENAILRRVDFTLGTDEAIRVIENVPLESGLSVTRDESAVYVTTIVSAEADLTLLEGLPKNADHQSAKN